MEDIEILEYYVWNPLSLLEILNEQTNYLSSTSRTFAVIEVTEKGF
jgi:hypothetical protein